MRPALDLTRPDPSPSRACRRPNLGDAPVASFQMPARLSAFARTARARVRRPHAPNDTDPTIPDPDRDGDGDDLRSIVDPHDHGHPDGLEDANRYSATSRAPRGWSPFPQGPVYGSAAGGTVGAGSLVIDRFARHAVSAWHGRSGPQQRLNQYRTTDVPVRH